MAGSGFALSAKSFGEGLSVCRSKTGTCLSSNINFKLSVDRSEVPNSRHCVPKASSAREFNGDWPREK